MAPDIAEPTVIPEEAANIITGTVADVNANTDTTGILHNRKNVKNSTELNNSAESQTETDETKVTTSSEVFIPSIRWPDLIVQIYLHIGSCYGLYLLLFCKYQTWVWCKYLH